MHIFRLNITADTFVAALAQMLFLPPLTGLCSRPKFFRYSVMADTFVAAFRLP